MKFKKLFLGLLASMAFAFAIAGEKLEFSVYTDGPKVESAVVTRMDLTQDSCSTDYGYEFKGSEMYTNSLMKARVEGIDGKEFKDEKCTIMSEGDEKTVSTIIKYMEISITAVNKDGEKFSYRCNINTDIGLTNTGRVEAFKESNDMSSCGNDVEYRIDAGNDILKGGVVIRIY
ncbi:MAG: hypothetical protein K2Q33_04620 [Gammaproteobacteria bacterium]|nr:hypothetical protein [Gammaproteobacteria bacterium]